ncbi:MAG TPA: hypothetical protein VNB22_08105 [Pyrinomonadaceae bacterium]|nr:hypothetical protein [Pyrinomonadaceae bacterium]
MILTFLIIFLITCGGTALSYLYEKEDSLLVRLAAGNVVGASLFATAGFLLACFFGLSAATVLIALVITLLPVLLLTKKDFQRQFKANLNKARGKLDGANFKKILKFAYYAGIFILLWLFFERAMLETKDGIFTGGSQNLGDLPFHLGAIFSFTEANNFPPENPSFAGAKFTYPFLADFVTACFVKIGASVRDAMLVQNVFLGFSLVVLLEKFTRLLTGSKTAGKIAPLLLLFSGGLGFVWFFKDYWQGTQSLTEILWKLPGDYTIGEKFRWGNSLVVLFLTQRSLLFGMPLTLIALTKIWEIFSSERLESGKVEKVKSEKAIELSDENFSTFSPFHFSTFFVGLIAGTLVLIHIHSLVVLFVVCAFLFFFRIDKWREWLAFAIGVAIIAVPELLWSLTGSASNLSKFIEPHFGWDSKDQNFVMFWAKNIGLFAPVLVAGIVLIYLIQGSEEDSAAAKELNSKTADHKTRNQPPNAEHLLLFYLPFAFLFLVSNTVKLAPWEWDNIKVLIYWFVGSLPFAAFVLAWAWEKTAVFKFIAAVCFVILTLSGALDVWRTISRQINYSVFSQDSVKIAELIKQKTAPNALFLNAPTYNSAVVLTGRRSLMRYSGHLSSYGIDYEPRESEVKRIYEGTALADRLLQKNNIEYVIISPEETGNVTVREEYFYKYPIIAEVGAYKVFKVK